MLRLKNVRGVVFQCFDDAPVAFEARASLSDASDGDSELFKRHFPKSTAVEREDSHRGLALAQGLNCIKKLPLGSALAKRSGEITNF